MTEERLWMLARHLDGYVENDILRDLRQEISYGEYGLGLENLCEQLFESNARLPKVILDEIVEAANLMQLPAERWDFVMALEEWPEDTKY